MTEALVVLIAFACGVIAWLWQRTRVLKALHAESERRARAEADAARVPGLEAALVERSQELALHQAKLAELETRIAEERKASGEKLAMLDRARAALSDAFKALSSEALKSNNQSFIELAKATLEKFQEGARSDLEKRQKAVDELVKPIRESLEKVDGKLGEIERSRIGAYSALNEQLKGLVGPERSRLSRFPRRFRDASARRARLRAIRPARLVRLAARGEAQPLAQPGREIAFRELAFGEGEHRDVLFLVGRNELRAVQLQKRPISDMRGALVAVHGRMIAREAMRERSREIGEVRRRIAVGVQLLRPCQRRFQQPLVAYPSATAMLRDLAVVDGKNERFFQPNDHRDGSARRQLAQHVAVLPHHALRHLHLPGELRIERRQLDPVRQLRRIQRVALPKPQPREQLLRQDDPGGISDGGDLDFHGHTSDRHYNVRYI